MSIFYCDRCGRNRDSDYIECVEDPKQSNELMCWHHAEEDECPLCNQTGEVRAADGLIESCPNGCVPPIPEKLQ